MDFHLQKDHHLRIYTVVYLYNEIFTYFSTLLAFYKIELSYYEANLKAKLSYIS
jgi:hypothetical protein